VNSFVIYDCQIDAQFSWRPGFEDNEPRLRVALFSDRLMVTAYEDATEGLTRGTTLFAGARSALWREIVHAIVASEEFLTMNPDWPYSSTIVGPHDLKFKPEANTALKMIALSWLGAEWTEIAKFLMKHSDDELEKLDRTRNLLWAAADVSSETSAAFVGTTLDLGADEFSEALLAGELRGACAEAVAKHLIAKHRE
jgi:hypothetical protein